MTRIGYIYFVQAQSGPIKIGYTQNPQGRFKNFVAGHYEPLTFLGVIFGTPDEEKRLHRELKESHVHGEWFRPTPAVMSYVAKAFAPPPKDEPRVLGVVSPIEKENIEKAIKATRGDLTKAALVLGCARRTLQNRMRAFGMPRGAAGRKRKFVGEPH